MFKLLCIISAMILSSAGILKLLDGITENGPAQTIVADIRRNWGESFTLALAGVEFLLALTLLISRTRVPASLVATAPHASFAGVALKELQKPSPRSCGCFGTVEKGVLNPRTSLSISLICNSGLALGMGVPGAGRRIAKVRSTAPAIGRGVSGAGPMLAGGTRRAFSILELMVVLGVVTILAGILFPVIWRARIEGRATRCAANLSQIGVAFAAYASENRGYIPRWGNGRMMASPAPSEFPIWIIAVGRHLGLRVDFKWDDIPDFTVFQCPAHPALRVPSTYVMNVFAFETAPNWRGSPPIQISRVRNPANLPLVLEASDRFGLGYHGSYDLIYFEAFHVVYDPVHLQQRVRFYRHANRSNVLWGDGHVSSVKNILPLDAFDDGLRAR